MSGGKKKENVTKQREKLCYAAVLIDDMNEGCSEAARICDESKRDQWFICGAGEKSVVWES